MIESFRGDYSFLSNFTKLEKPIIYEGVSYPTTEHFYQAMKSTDKTIRDQVAKHPSKGLKAFSRTYETRGNWGEIKDKVMRSALKWKFSKANPQLLKKLKSTGNEDIQEGNWWNDKYWGVCLKTGEGENKLGKMLMEIREGL